MSFTIQEYTAADLGVSGALLSAAPDTAAVYCAGADLVTFELDHVNDGGVLTITAGVECRRRGGTWRPAPTRSIAAGVETVSNRSMSRVTTAAEVAALAAYWDYPLEGIDADEVRLKDITAVGAGAGDTITVRARVRRPV